MRRLALSIAVSSALLANQASALGLGELNVKSALNEPLQAEVQLLQVRDLKASEIRPKLADDDAFSLAGLSRSGVLSSVDFDVELNAQGGAKVVISSDTPVREPFISFLMEVNWPNGRLVREYTLLLDPPLFAESTAPSAPVKAPAVSGPSPDPVKSVKPTAQKVLTANPAQTVQTTLRSDNVAVNQVYVDVNDTLYALAQENLPDETVSVNQMMLAIQRLNPKSFPTNNINVLKAGTMVTIPDSAQAKELSALQAAREVRNQYDDWKNGRRSSAPTPVEKAEVTAKDQPKAETSSTKTSGMVELPEAKLKLVSVEESVEKASTANDTTAQESEPEEPVVVADSTQVEPESVAEIESTAVAEAADESGEVSVDGQQDVSSETVESTPREQALLELNRDLENKLLVTQESVEKVNRDNADLSAKLDSIAEQLETMQRLIELKDQQVAQLQQQLDLQMQSAQQRNEDPIATAIDYIRMNPEIVGGSAVAFLLLLLMLLRSSRKSAPRRDAETVSIKENDVAAVAPAAMVAPSMAVVEPSPVEATSEPAADPVIDEKPDLDPDGVAKAEAEIQSMIDEVLRARASEQAAQAEMEASINETPEESAETEIETETETETETVSSFEADDFLSRANAAMSSPESEMPVEAADESVESQPESDELEEFLDSELEAALSDTDAVESLVESVEEEVAELEDLDFVIESFDSEVSDEPQESQIPSVDMPESIPAGEPDQASSIDEDLAALEVLMGNVSDTNNSDVEAELQTDADEPLDVQWEFVVEESDSGSLDGEIEKIFDEVDGDVEVVEEINDTTESEEFDTHFFSGADENETRLDLARAYIEMDDYEAARDILVSMKDKGSSAQQQEVANLLDKLDKA